MKRSGILLLFLSLSTLPALAQSLSFDFEDGTLSGWTVTEAVLPHLLSSRSNRFHDNKPYMKSGKWHLSTLDAPAGGLSDSQVGVVESPEFVASAATITLRIAGGSGPDVYLALCDAAEGEELAKVRGANSQDFREATLAVPPEKIGKPLFFRLVDRSTGGWGHILVDELRVTGALVPSENASASKRRALAAKERLMASAVASRLADFNPQAMRAMLEDLAATQGARFTRAPEFLSRLKALEERAKLAAALMAGKPTSAQLEGALSDLMEVAVFQREIVRANPLVSGAPIVYVVRPQYLKDHHNTENLFHTGEPNCASYRPGGPMKLLDVKTGRTSVLVDPGATGLVRDPDVHFDGKKILVSMRKSKEENYSIYEIDVDPQTASAKPGATKRLTGEIEASDIDPLYLPDGKIVFSSTREPKYCHCNMHIMANLNRMDGDGANIHQISKNTLFDGHPSLLPDGRILYYRWEYVDRNFADAQGLWTVNPDGTGHAIYWKNNVVSPAAAFDARVIPGTAQVACILGSCHDMAWGAFALVDRSKGIDSLDAIQRVWPESVRKRFSVDGSEIKRKFAPDEVMTTTKGRYEDPYPLVDPATGKGGKYFLVSRSLSLNPSSSDELRMGLFVLDTFGNEILLHEEGPGCYDPMPLASHPRPRVVPDRRNFTDREGTLYVSDVYEGTHVKNVKRGDIKWLRVVESTEKRVWTGPGWQTAQWPGAGGAAVKPVISWAGFETKRILGTVPVEADGSAHFKAPAEKFIYFQTLDSNGMLVSTMRSGTLVQPGEVQGCVGCHEDRLSAPPPKAVTLALKRAPSVFGGWRGPLRTFNYLAEVQPVWDKHCVSCHDFGKEAGKKLVLSGDKELYFNASYMQLFRAWGTSNAYVSTVGLGVAPFNQAYAIGSHQSRLVSVLRAGHQGVKLSPEDFDRIVTWVDLGGPYYPDYASSHPANPGGRSPLTLKQLQRLQDLTGAAILGKGNAIDYNNHRLWFSFTRPEKSPCLEKLAADSAAYQEALALITAGKDELAKNPEADQAGFKPCEAHVAREAKYQRLLAAESERRKAIAQGAKRYDAGIGKP
jgi:hypothetical protein